MPILLLSGFRSFADEPRNPSGEIAGELAGAERSGFRIEAAILPVSRAQVLERLAVPLDRYRPAAVIGLGLARKRAVVTVEQRARNLEDYEIPDELGQQPRGEPVLDGGPAELEATLPVEDLVRGIREVGVPARASHDAGSFVCNRLYYGLLQRALEAPEDARYRAVFIHLPPLPDCVAGTDNERASMTLELAREAVEAAILTTIRALG